MEGRERAADFLGCGIAFPPRVDAVTGRMQMSVQEEDIKEAIRIILFTGKGERVKQALIRWEPRITDTEVRVNRGRMNQGIAEIQIRYVVRATNNPYNLVFPYYINEGTV